MWDEALEAYMRDKSAGNRTLVRQRQIEYNDEDDQDEEYDEDDKKEEVYSYDNNYRSSSLDPAVEELIEAMMKEKENA